MSILDLAKQHASERNGMADERRRAIEEKRARLDRDTAELFARLSPLASQPVTWQGRPGRLHVAMMPTEVVLTITARQVLQGPDGTTRLRDTREVIAQATARASKALEFVGFATAGTLGAVKGFGQFEDLERHVAEVVGGMLVLEE